MIDTDKYEGHSEGEWKVGARKGAMTVRDSNGEEIAATNSYSNARIMADSPLLLEEVKRLREETKWFRERLCRHIGYDYCKSEYEKHFGREMIE
jgi:hypothetical protein